MTMQEFQDWLDKQLGGDYSHESYDKLISTLGSSPDLQQALRDRAISSTVVEGFNP